MNYTDTKTDIKADLFIKQMKGSRIPSHMGSFSSLLAQNMRIVDLSEFTRGLNEGKVASQEEGFNLGLEKGLKEFMVNGENQIFVDKKDGKVYMFRNNAQLLNSEKIGQTVKDFTANQVYKPKVEEYQNFINNYVQTNLPGSVKVNNLSDFEEQFKLVEKDLKERKKNIRGQYSKLVSDGDQYKIDLIDIENKGMIETLEHQLEENQKEIDNLEAQVQTKRNTLNTKKSTKVNKNRLESAIGKFDNDISELGETQKLLEHMGDLTPRKDIQILVDQYVNDNNSFLDKKIINDSIETLKGNKTKITTEFTNFKNRETAMMLTDDFNIYNVEQIRKIYPKNTGPVEEDIFAKIKERKEFALESKDIINTIADYRTNKQQITLKNLDEQLLIPQQKVTLTPDLYLYMKYPKEGEPLEIEGSIKKSKYTTKSTSKK